MDITQVSPPAEHDPTALIPVERLRPILDRHYRGAEQAIVDLPGRSGLSVRVVKRIIRRHVDAIDFWTADALLTAVDEVQAWRTELDDLYEAAA